MNTTPCPTCKAPCVTTVNSRGGDYGWGTSDAERTVYRYATATKPTLEMLEEMAYLLKLVPRGDTVPFEFIEVLQKQFLAAMMAAQGE